MNRFKKEVRKLGYKLDMDYPCLPYNGIDSAWCNAEKANYYVYHYCMGLITHHFDRAMECTVSYEDDNPRF